MAELIFRKLQQQLDLYSLGFPAASSGVEIKILEKLFSLSDAELFLKLSPKLELPEEIALKVNMSVDQASDTLADMADRGLLFSLNKSNQIRYAAIPFVHGIFEFQVNSMNKELAGLVRQYIDEEFKENLSASMADFLRVIPVQQSIDTTSRVAPYEDAVKILEAVDQIVVADCACRKSYKIIDQGCGRSLETCFMFGSMAQYYLDHGLGRKIELDEAVKILSMAHDQGLVTQPATSQNPSGMCNCCGDCCGPLSSLKDHPKPAELVFSNYQAIVDPAECTGCETCLDRCQMGAIDLDQDMIACINLDRCIGCGLCVTTCPTEAIRLDLKDDNDFKTPPETTFEQMMNMAKKRKII